MQKFAPLFKLYGLRRTDQLLRPRVLGFHEFEFPLNSLYHWIPEDDRIGPKAEDLDHFDNLSHIYVDHVTQMVGDAGFPRYTNNSYLEQIRNYHSNNRGVNWLKRDAIDIIDPKALIVESYTAIRKQHIYQTVKRSIVDSFTNRYTTLFNRVNELAVSERNQFVRITLPDVIPLKAKYEEAARIIDVMPGTLIDLFNTEAELFTLELWKWVSQQPSLFDLINVANYRLFNILLHCRNRTVWLNLGVLDDWRLRKNEEEKDIGNLKPRDFQLRLLKLLLVVTTEPKVRTKDAVVDGVLAEFKAVQKDDDGDDSGNSDDIEELTNSADVETEDDLEKEIDQQQTTLHTLAGKVPELDLDTEVLTDTDETTVSNSLTTPLVAETPYEAEVIEGTDQIIKRAQRLAEQGAITIPELERYISKAKEFDKIPSPFGKGTLKEFMVIKPNDLTLTDKPTFVDQPTITDKTMLYNSVQEFDNKYIDNVLQKDVTQFIGSIRKAGVLVTDVKAEKREDILNNFMHYTVTVEVPGGKQTTLHMDVPIPDENGVFLSGGVKYFLKKQLGDMPIRKVNSNRVSLTSYYGKLFIDRSQNVSVNFDNWLLNQIQAVGLDAEDPRVSHLESAECLYHTIALPKIYTTLSSRFSKLTALVKHPTDRKGVTLDLVLDYTKRKEFNGVAMEALFTEAEVRAKGRPIVVEKLEQQFGKGSVFAGTYTYGKTNGYVVIDAKSVIHCADNLLKPAFSILSLPDALNLPLEKAPVNVATVNIFGDAIPVVLMLGYKMGLHKLLKTLNANYRTVPSGKMLNLTNDEFRIKFKNESWIFSKKDPKTTLIVGGLHLLNRYLVNYNSNVFDKKEIYLNILEEMNVKSKIIKEFDIIFKLFVDHITESLLIEMHEPTDLVLLVLRAVELLTVDYYPEENDKNFMRIRGYERLAGAVYGQLVKALRTEAGNLINSKSSVDVNPLAVKLAILTDSSKDTYSEINPINAMKQQEVVTFGGTGGRKTETMVKRTRKYHKTDMGVISEATVDSGDVGITSYLSANPNFNSLRGTSNRFDGNKDSLTNVLSPSALLAVAAETDDPKRINFISIQQQHGIAVEGAQSMPVITGYEQVIANRVPDLFAVVAKQDGVVKSLTDKVIAVEYKDGSVKTYEIGRRFGKHQGGIIPHTLVTPLSVGSKFKTGDVVTYNSDHFEINYLNPNNLLWKNGVLMNVAIMDTSDTFEDSSVISQKASEQMRSKTTYVRTLVFNFNDNVNNLVEVGDDVSAESILCIIEDSITYESDLFDEESLNTLSQLSSASPRAKNSGKVEHIEVFYNGNVEEMSESLTELAMVYDRKLAKVQKALGKTVVSGKVDESYRIDGRPLSKNQFVINVYITALVPAGVGDKCVFGNQMKSVIGEVLVGANHTESGIDIDAIFGYQSISNRIVISPEIIGTTNMLLEVIGQNAAKLYFGESK